MATRTIGTELVLSGEKAFNDGMKAVNSNLKNLRSDMAATTAEFADNADSMEALTAKQKVLQSSVDQHRAKVDALQRMYDKQKEKYGENSAKADKYRQDLNNATVALNKEIQALKKNEEALEKAKKTASQYTPVTQRMANAVKGARDRIKSFTVETIDAAHHVPVLSEAMDIAKVSAKGLGAAVGVAGTGTKKAFSGMGKAASGMGKMVGGAAAGAAAAVVAVSAASGAALLAVAGWAKEQAEAAKAAHESGEKLTDSQKKWLSFSQQLDALETSAGNAKSAIAGILLPMLGELTTQGNKFLDSFAKDMTAATGDTQRQTQILGRYIADGARLIIGKLPEYITAGKELLGGVVTGFGEAAEDDELLDMGLDLIMDLLHFVEKEAPTLADGGLELALQILTGLEGQDVGASVTTFVTNLLNTLAEKAPELIPAGVRFALELLKGVAMNFGGFLEAGGKVLVAIKDGALAGLDVLQEVGPEIVDELISSLKGSDSAALQWCGEFIEKIKNGILEYWPKLTEWFSNLWDSLFGEQEVEYNFHVSSSGRIHGPGGGGSFDGSHANGLRYVPYDGYLAELHRGEAVLTAREAEAYRSGQTVTKIFNLHVHTTSVSKEEMSLFADYMDEKMGDDLP